MVPAPSRSTEARYGSAEAVEMAQSQHEAGNNERNRFARSRLVDGQKVREKVAPNKVNVLLNNERQAVNTGE